MISEKDLKKVIEQVLLELGAAGGSEACSISEKAAEQVLDIEEGLPDITAVDLKKQVLVPTPEDLEGLLKMKETTPARIGVWRAGPRYKTETLLRFRADHAVAMDAVFSDVSEAFLQEMNLISIKTKCRNKDEYLTRPDLGRKFEEEALDVIRKNCVKNPQVQIYVSDGLSSTAVEANIRDILPAIQQGLEGYGIKMGTPFFVKYGRVPAMDVISETLEADVTCVLIGERPGLATGESMSAYMAYKATVNMPEARRTVVSNIHKGGTPAVEAGAHIAHILKLMLDKKASGLDLKL
ncbi:ethanolamine ammonia-lyase subunit EutC [Geosporobacter ferrireducens]|uniref:Ethanolamine ammonia-lyase small subunit n=1 Tax=Geosporobacter ferrireducens TaxID=1424294 RepID=A0A1D8GJ17_9FIRM|nr:ethanolamine ammonia-lyase subunit EutC [Geosporobacter ferrireducens]AOT70905.1 ethanolamine ammonia-lyase [Geosporobacter ferrireducens]MTI53611.1 ethanolamine ammonia-lyase subunit EutC [Geosporobacter ferrireducens]